MVQFNNKCNNPPDIASCNSFLMAFSCKSKLTKYYIMNEYILPDNSRMNDRKKLWLRKTGYIFHIMYKVCFIFNSGLDCSSVKHTVKITIFFVPKERVKCSYFSAKERTKDRKQEMQHLLFSPLILIDLVSPVLRQLHLFKARWKWD